MDPVYMPRCKGRCGDAECREAAIAFNNERVGKAVFQVIADGAPAGPCGAWESLNPEYRTLWIDAGLAAIAASE